MKPIIAPSILSADFGQLAKDIEMINRSEAEWAPVGRASGPADGLNRFDSS